MTDIFKFWRQIEPAATVHPADVPTFDRLKGQHEFDLKCLPLNFSGPLRTAPVVLLYLSPGFSPADRVMAKTPKGQQIYAQQRTGRARLPNASSLSGHQWRSRRLAFVGNWEEHLDKIAVMNIGAYHSKNFSDHDTLASLPSSRVALDWAQSVLFPEAEAGRRVVVCMRAANYWGLRRGSTYGKSLFAPASNRAGYLPKDAMRSKIVKAVRSALNG